MRVTLHPECPEDIADIRSRAAASKHLSENLTDPMYWAVAQACVQWDADNPDLQGLKPGSIIECNGRLYVVQPNGKWFKLPGDRPGTLIDPTAVNLYGARIQWRAE